MRHKNIGFGLFLVYLAVSVLEISLVLGIGTITDMASLVHILEILAQIGLISKLLILAMFGLLFTEENGQ